MLKYLAIKNWKIIAAMNEIDFTKICRVCCQEESILLSIFKVHISKKLMHCTSIQVTLFICSFFFVNII